MQKFLSALFCSFVFVSTTLAYELGDASKFAVRFDDKTGNLTEIIYKGEPITIPGGGDQRFDIQVSGGGSFALTWVSAGAKLEFTGIVKESDSAVKVTQKYADWTAVFRYEINVNTVTLGRSVEITYTGKNPTKIKSFWMSLPTFPFKNNAEFFIPGQYPPKKYNAGNFAENDRKGSMQNSAPLVFQLDKSKSVILLSDNLIDYADRPNNGIERRDGGVRLTQSFNVLGHVKPNTVQKLGDAYFRIVDSDSETALLKIHDLMRQLGQVPPKDRPKWFGSAILYSFHPGGTIGSNCKDLGGFKPATELLDRIKQLGCNAIWLMPLEDKSIYWPRDYYKFQDGLGSTPETAAAEYKALVNKAHELGLHVLQDSVPHGGGNPNERSIAHPEWLVQDEDGKTFDYWGFDFNSPTWIDYMGEVSRYYVKEYGIDGYRVDACGGSRFPNWNPEIPYARASHSQSQGGLNMLRKIRQAVKEEQPDGGILAEVNTGIWGAVSDATYDFDLCYNVLHDARKLPADEFVQKLRRWLHEQQYGEIPDMLRLRHVESHDSLRAQLWYGTEPHRALMALTAFIHGIPLVYHEEEIGNAYAFRKIFAIRNAIPELQGGDANYLAVDAPPGVFACLRTKDDDASIILINFNDNILTGKISIAWDKLPEAIRSADSVFCQQIFWQDDIIKESKVNGQFQKEMTFSPNDVRVIRLTKDGKSSINRNRYPAVDFRNDNNSFSRRLQSAATEETETGIRQNDIKLNLIDSETEAYIDPETGLLARYYYKGEACLGLAELALPEDVQKKGEKPVITVSKNDIIVRQKFGEATLNIKYIAVQDERLLRIETNWEGNNIPQNAALCIPVIDPVRWTLETSEGTGEYGNQPPHVSREEENSSIYWRPQGTNILFDSLQHPMLDAKDNRNFRTAFRLRNANPVPLDIFVVGPKPVRYRQLLKFGDEQGIFLVYSWTDESVPKISSQPQFIIELGMDDLRSSSLNADPKFRTTVGGYVYENDHYKLRFTRSGTIMSLDMKEKEETLRSIIHEGDLYTDYGYGSDKLRYAAGNDVEAGCRIVQDGDTLRLRFEGQLRGKDRFDLMRPPVEYFTEYTLNDSPAFAMSCGVKTHRVAAENKAFLSLFLPMPNVEKFIYFDQDGKTIAEGSNIDTTGRGFQTKNTLPERVVLQDAEKTLLELAGLRGETSNLFLERKNFFVTFDDGETSATPDRWRMFAATVAVGSDAANGGKAPSFAAPLAVNDVIEHNTLIVDGDFEVASSSSVSGSDLVSLRTGAVVIKGRRLSTGWQTPDQGSIGGREVHHGHAAAQVIGEAGQYRLFAQDIPLTKIPVGTKLRLSAWVKGKDLAKGQESWQVGCVRLMAIVGGKTQYISSPNLLGTFDWRQETVEFIVPEKLQKLSVQVGSNGASGTIWIDEVDVQK